MSLEDLIKPTYYYEKNIKLVAFFVGTTLIISACFTKEKKEILDMDMVKTEIQAMEDAYTAGEKANDVDAIAAYYSEDVISYGANKNPVTSRAAIRKNSASNIAKDTTVNQKVYKIVDLFAEGNSAVEVGSWTRFDAVGNEK